MIRLGVIGYGRRIKHVINLMQRLGEGTEITAITDIRNDDLKQKLREDEKDPDKINFYTDADEMLDKEKLDGVLIGTRCHLHSIMGIKVLERDIPLFIEKPVATTMADLIALRDAAAKSKSEVVVSFPLRATPLVQKAKEIVDSGLIGTVEHVQAWNNVFYGGVYYHDWYRDENETHGLWFQKATHDFDYVNYLVGIKPVTIAAMTSKQIFKGDHPAGLKCKDCNEWDTCLESPFHMHFSSQIRKRVEPNDEDMCSFAVDTGNEDSGSALVRYDSGMHLAYSQNFFTRKGGGRRGGRFFGYKGTMEFDWTTDELKVFMHHSPAVQTFKIEASNLSHGGGDTVLVDNFKRVITQGAKSMSPLDAGLLSILMCLKAQESDKTNTFQEIKYPDR